MASSLFPPTSNNSNPVPQQRADGIPDPLKNYLMELGDRMYRTNPAFRDFAESMFGRDPIQAFQEKGLDYRKLFG